jgi:hypothetical protein
MRLQPGATSRAALAWVSSDGLRPEKLSHRRFPWLQRAIDFIRATYCEGQLGPAETRAFQLRLIEPKVW